MARPDQILIIDPPSELVFRGPFTGTPVTSYIKLTNPSSHNVCFKIKTTAPKRYCVRPNSGYLEPKEETKIAVILQPIDFDPAEKNKHKFMVQTLIAPDKDDIEFSTDLWKDISPNQLMDSKLKCVFQNPVPKTTPGTSTETTTIPKTEGGTDGKNKAVGDSVKSSPKVLGDTELKLFKAAHEVNQLRVEESTLRQENLLLKEDLMKLRLAAKDELMDMATRGMPSQRSSQMALSSTHVFIAIALVILGYLLGKMI